jgi:hypothetical protein
MDIDALSKSQLLKLIKFYNESYAVEKYTKLDAKFLKRFLKSNTSTKIKGNNVAVKTTLKKKTIDKRTLGYGMRGFGETQQELKTKLEQLLVKELRQIVRYYNLHVKIRQYSGLSKPKLIKKMLEHMTLNEDGQIIIINPKNVEFETVLKTRTTRTKPTEKKDIIPQVNVEPPVIARQQPEAKAKPKAKAKAIGSTKDDLLKEYAQISKEIQRIGGIFAQDIEKNPQARNKLLKQRAELQQKEENILKELDDLESPKTEPKPIKDIIKEKEAEKKENKDQLQYYIKKRNTIDESNEYYERYTRAINDRTKNIKNLEDEINELKAQLEPKAKAKPKAKSEPIEDIETKRKKLLRELEAVEAEIEELTSTLYYDEDNEEAQDALEEAKDERRIIRNKLANLSKN